MRLGEWRKAAPTKESMSTKVLAVLRPVLVDLGADADAECWVAWGDDPESRYSILSPTVAGLITMAVRITGPDGPRATAKLVRWSKVAVSELSVEASGGHRIVAVQVENKWPPVSCNYNDLTVTVTAPPLTAAAPPPQAPAPATAPVAPVLKPPAPTK